MRVPGSRTLASVWVWVNGHRDRDKDIAWHGGNIFTRYGICIVSSRFQNTFGHWHGNGDRDRQGMALRQGRAGQDGIAKQA